jgi:uncharacterized membrane protein YeaQ/YmgE (transglycosylase-associated protein family)
MTDTLIALISIFVGIVGANISGLVLKKYTFGFIGNTIAGVFGSIFFIKAFSRFGFDPVTIMQTGEPNHILFIVNIIVSFFGGILFVILLKKVKLKLDNI